MSYLNCSKESLHLKQHAGERSPFLVVPDSQRVSVGEDSPTCKLSVERVLGISDNSELGTTTTVVSGNEILPLRDACGEEESATIVNAYDAARGANKFMVRDSLWGLALYALSTIFLSAMSITAKVAGNNGMPVFEITLVRGMVVFVFAVPAVYQKRANPFGNRRGLVLLRSLVGFATGATLYASVQLLPLAEATVLSFLAPIWVALAGPLLIKEYPSKVVWIILPFCLLGVVLVVQPNFLFRSTASLSLLGVLVGCSQAVFSGSVLLIVRELRTSEDPSVIILHLASVTVLVSALLCALLPGGFVLPTTWMQGSMLLLTGLFAYGNQMALTYGLRQTKASTATAMTYLSMIWVELADVFIFHISPGMLEILGSLIILVCTAALTMAEQRKAAKRSLSEGKNAISLVTITRDPEIDDEETTHLLSRRPSL